MSDQQQTVPLATLKLALAAGYGLDSLELQTHDQSKTDAFAQIYGQVAQLAGAGQDYSHLAPALHKAAVDVVTAAFSSSGLQVHDFTAEVIQQANTQIGNLQAELGNLQATAQASVNEAYAKGLEDGAAQATAASSPVSAGGGFSLNIDTSELARQIAALLGAGNAKQEVAVANNRQQTAPVQLGGGGGLNIGGPGPGSGLQLGKPQADTGANAQPLSAQGADHPAYKLDPSLIGDGTGNGGGMPDAENTGVPTVAAVRSDASMHKVGLPVAKKQFAVGAKVFIVPSSEAAQWDGKPCVVADPAEGGDLEAIAESAKSALTKSLHYYVPN